MKNLISCVRLLALLALINILPSQAFAVAEGPEPNNPCTSAQDLDAVGIPFTIEGNLDGAVNPDIDFFKFTGSPGESIKVNLNGITLGDPFLGFFDSACNLITVNDDSNGTLNSQLILTVPADGNFILAATQCCDIDFNIGGNGTYQLTLQPFQPIGSVSGRVVNAVTQAALPGDADPFAFVRLLRCDSTSCLEVMFGSADSLGRFSFTTDNFGQPLEPGNYQVIASATDYLSGQTQISPVGAGENYDFGNIALQQRVNIGSISGRLVDASTNAPLPGNSDPFAFVFLYRCVNNFECFQVNQTSTDNDGRFTFTSEFGGQPLKSGTYIIFVSAQQYNQASTQFDVLQEGENRDVGDLSVQSFPVRFTNKVPCKKIPKKGGSCQYSVRVTNGLTTPVDGDAWSIVGAFGIGSALDFTTFQPKATQRVKLQPGESKTVKFDFPLPNSVNDNAYICADAYIGRRPSAIWDTVGVSNVFCITKEASGFTLMPAKEAHKMSSEMKGRPFHQMKPKQK
jgi:5-hydroxyisourate hydrolase-like protein (transthyretin family)